MSIAPDRILFSDPHLLAVNKLAGELVVRGSSLRRGYGRQEGEEGKLPLLDFLRKEYPGIRAVHRLDFGTSGIVMFARTRQAEEAIRTSQFAGWEKTYRTLVAGRMDCDRGAIRIPLPARGKFGVRNAKSGKPSVRSPSKNDSAFRIPHSALVPAETQYTVVRRFTNSTEVLCVIATGRHHQIRRHFAGIGHPLVCDDVYGNVKYNRTFTREFGYRSFFLHAERLVLPHPVTGQRMELAATLPRAFEEVLKKLERHS